MPLTFEVKLKVEKFVESISHFVDLQFDPQGNILPIFNPYQSQTTRSLTAHYSLIIASIHDGFIVGRPEDVRQLGNDFFKSTRNLLQCVKL
ncbi:hypothetical protein KEJ51_08775 [Candidatus Bathyarchaeota archaeon]|nr:hypothetical protein [Candidatus Bathyarchaeota archaeon]